MMPLAVPKQKNTINNQGCVPNALSRKYPMTSPTAIEDGSISPRELQAAIFLVSALKDCLFLNIHRVLS